MYTLHKYGVLKVELITTHNDLLINTYAHTIHIKIIAHKRCDAATNEERRRAYQNWNMLCILSSG